MRYNFNSVRQPIDYNFQRLCVKHVAISWNILECGLKRSNTELDDILYPVLYKQTNQIRSVLTQDKSSTVGKKTIAALFEYLISDNNITL